MSLDMIEEIAGTAELNPVPGPQILFSFFYAVPLLVAFSTHLGSRIVRLSRLVSIALAGMLAILFYNLVFSIISVHGTSQAAIIHFLVHLFIALDLFLAVASTIRLVGADRVPEQRFFYATTILLWFNAVFVTIHNELLTRHDYVWLDVLLSVPYVGLLLSVGGNVPPWLERAVPSRRIVHTVQSASTTFLALCLVILGLAVSRQHFLTGAFGVVFAVLSYALLSVTTESTALIAEDALAAGRRALEELVGIDGLTEIPNRRAFDQRIALECHAANRSHQPLTLVLIDIDFFKLLNDNEGHLVGDACLVDFAQALKTGLARASDFVARYGGEEFAVLLPSTDRRGADAVVKRLHRLIAEQELEHLSSPTGFVTFSSGYTTSDPTIPVTPQLLVQAADKALYAAKLQGRNQAAREFV